MVLNKFSLVVFIQIILIALAGMLLVISVQQDFMKMTTAGLVLLWVGQILFLNVYMSRIHRDVEKFMDALRSQDTSQFFNSRKAGRYFEKLYSSFNEINRNFRLVRIEKEVENQFFRELVGQSASGILAVSEDEHIMLINGAALEILGMDKLDHLRELREIHPDLAEIIGTGAMGGAQVKLLVNKNIVQLATKATEMRLDKTPARIYTLLDITREMARGEIEAWQKLIRVLHHEITNSIVPLHILSTSLFDLIHDGATQKSARELDDEVLNRIVLGLKTMVKRSGGLNDFINSYRSFTEIGEPAYSTFSVEELMGRVISLMEEDLGQNGVSAHIDVSPSGLQLKADEKLVEQILINLVKNSIYALDNQQNPLIQLRAWQFDDQVLIEIADNGKGIPEELIDTIFTPFFTTRKGGSGIGLSLARQVMLMHNGSISVASTEGEHTAFTLLFS